MTLRTGQSLFGYGTSVNAIYVKVFDLYNSDSVADRIQALLPYEARSWTLACSIDLQNVQALGADIKGLLGLNFLKSFQVTFDFKRSILTLQKP